MFGKRGPTTDEARSVIPVKFEKAPKPDDSELPEVPETKTWFVKGYDRAEVRYSGTGIECGDTWLTIDRITSYKWVYNGYSNVWCPQSAREVVVRTKVSHVISYGLVDQ